MRPFMSFTWRGLVLHSKCMSRERACVHAPRMRRWTHILCTHITHRTKKRFCSIQIKSVCDTGTMSARCWRQTAPAARHTACYTGLFNALLRLCSVMLCEVKRNTVTTWARYGQNAHVGTSCAYVSKRISLSGVTHASKHCVVVAHSKNDSRRHRRRRHESLRNTERKNRVWYRIHAWECICYIPVFRAESLPSLRQRDICHPCWVWLVGATVFGVCGVCHAWVSQAPVILRMCNQQTEFQARTKSCANAHCTQPLSPVAFVEALGVRRRTLLLAHSFAHSLKVYIYSRYVLYGFI